MDLKFIFYLVLSISSIHVDATTVNRMCFIPEITDSDDMNMLELSLVISSYLNDTESVESTLNNHLLFIYKLDTNLECLLTFYMEKILNLGKLVEQTINKTPKSNVYFLSFLMNIISLCTELQSEKYVSFHRDVEQLMSEYENLINMSTYTKKAVKKTYVLEHLTACVCKEVKFKSDYYNILVSSNIFLMHQNTLSYILVNNFAKLNQISTNRDAKDLCIELVIDEAQLLNIIYDFEYRKHIATTITERGDTAKTASLTFDDYLKSMFPDLTTSNRFTNIVYMAWTDVEEKIDFYFRHAKHNELRDCSKKCLRERLTTIKNHLNAVLLDKKHPLNNQDKSTEFMHFVCERINVF